MKPEMHHIEEAVGIVDMSFDELHIDTMLQHFPQKLRRHQQKRTAVGAAVAALAALLCFGLYSQLSTLFAPQPELVPMVADAGAVIDKAATLPDGSQVQASGAVALRGVSGDEVRLEVTQGRGRFEVTKNPKRRFVVEAAEVDVTVLGTVFSVERLEGDRVRVVVEEGRVQVAAPHRTIILTDGMSQVFDGKAPTEVVATKDEPALEEHQLEEPPAAVEATKRTKTKRRRKSRRDWRSLARKGDFKAASRAIDRDKRQVQDNVQDLMLAADAMRLAGKDKKALGYLNRIARKYRKDSRAPLAFFTRGRLLLKRGKAKRAAADFATVQKLSPKGSLVEDALAREVEALSKAGKRDAAKSRAERYIKRYPEGRRLRAVKRYGSLK